VWFSSVNVRSIPQLETGKIDNIWKYYLKEMISVQILHKYRNSERKKSGIWRRSERNICQSSNRNNGL